MKPLHIVVFLAMLALLAYMFATDPVGDADAAYARHMDCVVLKECSK